MIYNNICERIGADLSHLGGSVCPKKKAEKFFYEDVFDTD